jgi:hypothetical protein
VEHRYPWAGAGVDIGAVEFGIELIEEVVIEVFGLAGAQELLVDRLESSDEFGSLAGLEYGGPPAREPLDGTDDAEEFPCILPGQRRDRGSGLASRARGDDIALLLQALECATYRGPAHIEAVRHLGLDDSRAGRQPAMHDQFSDLFIYPGLSIRGGILSGES